MTYEYNIGLANQEDIYTHLLRCDDLFIPQLSSRVDIENYSKKIFYYAKTFEAWLNGELIGLVAAYCNTHENNTAFITSVSVLQNWQRKGIATKLIYNCLEYMQIIGIKYSTLEVSTNNINGIHFYTRLGFTLHCKSDKIQTMKKHIL